MPLGSAASAETAKGIYLAVSPFASAGVTYTVATNAANYTFVSSAAKTFEMGNIYDIALNLTNPNAVREDLGGEIVVCGTPGEVAACDKSYTGQFLKKYLAE